EMRALMEPREIAPPQPFGPWVYGAVTPVGAEDPTILRRPREGGADATLLDVGELRRRFAYFRLGAWRPAPTHAHLAWSADTGGAELFTIRVRDLATGVDLADTIPDATGRVVWAQDGRSFLYLRLDEAHRPARVLRHRLETDPATDELLHEERDPAWLLTLGETGSGAFATITARRSDDSEVRIVDLARAGGAARLVAPRRDGLRVELDHAGEVFVIRTNAGGAEDFKLVAAPVDAPDEAGWRDLVPHRPGVTIMAHRCAGAHVARLERSEAATRLVVSPLGAGAEATVPVGAGVAALSFEPTLEPGTIRFSVSTPVQPREVHDLEPASRATVLVKRETPARVPDPDAYLVARLEARAPDGERVPVSVVHRRDLVRDGSAPLLLYAYGSYGWSVQPGFAPERLPLLDRGFVYAIAHVRGGTERGQRWYREAKFEKKPNTFNDFIACAEMLAQEGYTAPGRIVAQGRSAGGMLVGAVANLRPDLFAGIVADVPFVDVLNTTLDDTLPLTPTEWSEWGNPIRDPGAFRAIAAYSPYDNVRPGLYPPILATAGIADPRVTYWEPAKWIARLRATATAGGPFLLKTDMAAGHAGRGGRLESLAANALEIAFALRCVHRHE
ncbi:MAG TPA: prolyl oligopeptidase family serine peptidase, partial [Salinarimonas sp.]|nr:prolyl oligopeptidase family serine peptidase [Salinarimonas sp.]